MQRTISSLLTLLIVSTLATEGGAAACEFSQDNFYVQYGLQGGNIYFRVVITGIGPQYGAWNAIGFGRSMWSGLDVIVIRILNGRAIVSDEYVRGFSSPYPDASNDIVVDSSSTVDNMLVVSFHRPAFTRDTAYDAQLSGCQSWKFATGTNPLTMRGEMYTHRRTPTSRQVCIEQCRI